MSMSTVCFLNDVWYLTYLSKIKTTPSFRPRKTWFYSIWILVSGIVILHPCEVTMNPIALFLECFEACINHLGGPQWPTVRELLVLII